MRGQTVGLTPGGYKIGSFRPSHARHSRPRCTTRFRAPETWASGAGREAVPFGDASLGNPVLWYFPECEIALISTSCVYMSMSQNVGKSVKPCARPLRFPWTSLM